MDSEASFQTQRRSPRLSFVVTAEIVDENSRTLIARLRNLNLNGCCIELGNPPPEGSSITITVTAGKTVFQARGRVVYADANAGSGVEFQHMERNSAAILEAWLLEAQEVDHPEET